MDANKKSSVRFLEMVIAGDIDEAYEQYVDMSGKHHNIFTAAGFLSLRDGMKENEMQFPRKRMSIKHVVGDGDLVAVHSHLTLDPEKQTSAVGLGQINLAVVHLFRFGADGKIAEMWDIGQAIAADSPNKAGAF